MEQDKMIGVSEWLARFFNGPDPQQQAYEQIARILAESPDLTVAQVYNLIAFGRGVGKSHCSGKPEGKMKFS